MMRQIVYVLIGAIVLAVIGAIIGLIIGMNIGGNYYPTFQFGGFLRAIGGGLSGKTLGQKKN